jgi:hypothetical protein
MCFDAGTSAKTELTIKAASLDHATTHQQSKSHPNAPKHNTIISHRQPKQPTNSMSSPRQSTESSAPLLTEAEKAGSGQSLKPQSPPNKEKPQSPKVTPGAPVGGTQFQFH